MWRSGPPARGSPVSILLVGVSHHSAPVAILEAVAVAESQREALTAELLAGDRISEAMIVTTCNRVEVYSAVDAFHPALDDVVGLLSGHSGVPVEELSRHLYVRYSEAAAEHPVVRKTGAWLDEHADAPAALRRIVSELLDDAQRAVTLQIMCLSR